MNKQEMLKQIMISMFSLIAFSSCEEVITINLNDTDPQVVIIGSVSNQLDTVMVSISQTANYFQPSENIQITGADVSISDDRGNSYQLTEEKEGQYSSVFAGLPGVTYDLSVKIDDTDYTASSTMPFPVPIESAWITTENWHESVYNMMNVMIQDPPNIDNYYYVKVFRNDTVISNENYLRSYSDKYFDGLYNVFTIWTDTKASTGDTYKVQLFNIDYNFSEYINQFGRVVDQSDLAAIAASTPANPTNNISNGALGYFTACSISEDTFVE
nr:DUF4249 domain-containing protein [uncultured Carboxylicivirga sp.]